jgi:hypothetical protein
VRTAVFLKYSQPLGIGGAEPGIFRFMTVGPDISGLSHARKDALISSLMAQVAALAARSPNLRPSWTCRRRCWTI